MIVYAIYSRLCSAYKLFAMIHEVQVIIFISLNHNFFVQMFIAAMFRGSLSSLNWNKCPALFQLVCGSGFVFSNNYYKLLA